MFNQRDRAEAEKLRLYIDSLERQVTELKNKIVHLDDQVSRLENLVSKQQQEVLSLEVRQTNGPTRQLQVTHWEGTGDWTTFWNGKKLVAILKGVFSLEVVSTRGDE